MPATDRDERGVSVAPKLVDEVDRFPVSERIQAITGALFGDVRIRRFVAVKQRYKFGGREPDDESIGHALSRWLAAREQVDREGGGSRWQFVTRVVIGGKERPFLIVLEREPDGGLDLVTAHARRETWFAIWMANEDLIWRRGEE